MAFAVVSKGAPLAAGLLKNLRLAMLSTSLLGPAASVAATRRLYGTGGTPLPFHRAYYYYYYYEAIGDERVLYHHHQLHHPIFYPSFFTSADLHAVRRWWWVSKQDEHALEVTVAMPGITAERVKVWTNKKGMFIKEGVKKGKGTDDVVFDDPAAYSCHIELCADAFDLDKAQSEMKCGLLRVTVPRVKGYLKEIKVVNAE